MESSAQLQGLHAVVSPSGQYLAFVSTGKLKVCSTSQPERFIEVVIRITEKDISALRWADDSSHITILSARSIEIVDLDNGTHRIRLDNGSGGLGRFTSADFIGSDQLLVTWEFGKAKLWELSNGKGVDLSDVKTVHGTERWQMRPGNRSGARRVLATLSRPGADDILNVYFTAMHKHTSSTKLPTTDAQSVSWSPDGRWLAILDTPITTPSLHIYTPDGHHFRSYPAHGDSGSHSLGVKAALWSGDSRILALTRYDGRIVLLNTRTFAPLAIIEHTTTVDQRSLPSEEQAIIWQESVLASGERSYTAAAQPISPPLSKTKSSTEPSELGVAEARFSTDGSYLATRDERMLNTVWIWNMATFAAHAVLIQHSNVRKLHWHPTQPDILMVDCGEGIAYVFNAATTSPPSPLSTSMPGTPVISWVYTAANARSVLLASTKASFRLNYPEGQPAGAESVESEALSHASEDEPFDEGASEDSLFDVLSGKKPLPPKTEESYTERVDSEVETEEEDSTLRVDDTFREQKSRRPIPVDPFDDSQIF